MDKNYFFQKPRMWEYIYSQLFLNSFNILFKTNAFSYFSTNAPLYYLKDILEYLVNLVLFLVNILQLTS